MRSLVRSLFLLSSGALFAIAIWLVSVTFFVLPDRDPAHLPMWRAVASAIFAYAALSVVALRARPTRTLRGVSLAASVAAVAAGCLAVASAARNASHGGHFEGYMLLMGLVVAGHGIAAILSHSLPSHGSGSAAPAKMMEQVR